MGADYASAIMGLASMAASALAHKHKIKQEKQDTRADTAYDIQMENAAALGGPGARYMQQAHDALTHNKRLDREPVDYGQGLQLLRHSLPGVGNDLLGGSKSPDASAKPVPDTQLDYTLKLPESNGPLYPSGVHPLGVNTTLDAPDWSKLRLDDLEDY